MIKPDYIYLHFSLVEYKLIVKKYFQMDDLDFWLLKIKKKHEIRNYLSIKQQLYSL